MESKKYYRELLIFIKYVQCALNKVINMETSIDKQEREQLTARLRDLNEIGAALSSEHDIDKLLENILLAAKKITNADAGTLYLVDTEKQVLTFEILRNDTLNIKMGGTTGQTISFYPVQLYVDGAENLANVVSYSALRGETINIQDAYVEQGFDFSGTKKFDAKTGYHSRSFLAVPMRNHESEIIGVLQLINAISPETKAIVQFSHDDQRLLESLGSQAAIALSNRRLIRQLEELFESFVKLINTAIDDKSPYTGGHCERVPELTMMIAEAATHAQAGSPLNGFSMSEAEKYELRIAALLHDCGKITTPVHVVDKATKLQTIYDRINLIDTRFEVLKRDAEIALLRIELMAGRDSALVENAKKDFTALVEKLESDRAFLQHCNQGSEKMSDQDQERVKRIAKYSWINQVGEPADFLNADELENLTIRAGTLTAPERGIINHHIVSTLKMLESLQWPKHLKHVPEFAGGHHERMDGKGYPRGLTRDQMSVQARMMGIADIFEALTAKDRPYKHGKTLTESLTILGKFKEGGHIDPDLFDLFIREKVYLKYAKQFLDPIQIDEVDVSKIPGYTP
jgi:HD-GYP domain-containing protein (c-di-GMP phosphodiesterase class II)